MQIVRFIISTVFNSQAIFTDNNTYWESLIP